VTKISINGLDFEIPQGFIHVKWQDVELSQTVYMIGQHRGKPFAYGPYVVFDKINRLLVSNNNRPFHEYVESLLIRG
jgi:hypothetical protein